MRVLVAPDKFKGSLTAQQAAAAMADGWRDAWPDAAVVCRPVADGGEGSAEAIHDALAGRWIETTVHDPLGRLIPARYTVAHPLDRGGQLTAFVDCSAASGYLLVRPHERDLPRSSTFGTGELLAYAFADSAVAKVIVGLGGSATNDGGLGMAAALRYGFLDRNGESIPPYPHGLGRLARIVAPTAQPWTTRPVVAACDVQNPLLGPRGATRVYGPQKGLQSSQQDALESGLARLADVARDSLGVDLRDAPGAGAAGGLGYGLLTFCAGRLEPGFDLLAGLLGLEEAMAAADIVVTGEGAADAQSLEGKAPHGVAAMARRFGKPVILVAGTIPAADRAALRQHFDGVHAMTDSGSSVEDCIRDASNRLRGAVGAAATAWRQRRTGSL